jgi:hypothetical protein
MSRYGRSGGDDGSMMSGILVMLAIIAALVTGYFIRDSGYVVNATKTPTQEVKTK